MIVCPNCQHHNADTAEQCTQCGHSLANAAYRVCPSCGALNPFDGQFCQRCLTDLTAPQTAPPSPETAPPPPPEAEEPELVPAEESHEHTISDEAPSAPREIAPLPRATTGIEPLTEQPEVDLSELGGDPLAGVADVLPLETAVALPRRATIPAGLQTDMTEQQDADLFASLAAEPAPLTAAAQQVLPQQAGDMSRLLSLLLALALLLAACVPVFSPGWLTPATTLSPSTRQLLGTLTSLGGDAHVLVAFEYGPDHAAELAPLASLILEQLADQGVRLHVLSSQPSGLGLAERMIHDSAVLQDALDSDQITLLGLLPGRETGIRMLMRSVDQTFCLQADSPDVLPADLTHTPSQISGFDRVLLLGDDSRTMRVWIEQAPPEVQPLAIVTAQIQPVLAPYRASEQLLALAPGAMAAIELQTTTSRPITPAGATDGLAALFILIVLIAILANVRLPKRRNGD